MSRSCQWFLCLVFFAMGCLCGLILQHTAVAQEKGDKLAPGAPVVVPSKWEYRIVEYGRDAEHKLNELGKEGFEIVTHSMSSQVGSVYTLKRIKKD